MQIVSPCCHHSAVPACSHHLCSHCSSQHFTIPLGTGSSRKRGIFFAQYDTSEPVRAAASSGDVGLLALASGAVQLPLSFRKVSHFCSTSSDCILIAWCSLADFWFRSWDEEKNKVAVDGTAKTNELLAGMPGHLLSSLWGLSITPCGTTVDTVLDSSVL